MCIIAVKPKGVNPPSKEILQNMFEANPDGAGIAYNIKGKLYIIKGLMTFEEFFNKCKEIPKESGAIYHTRIETSGGVCKELTHPFFLNKNILEQRKTNVCINKGEAVAHNGVFNEFTHKKLNSDTTQFISNYLSPLKELKDTISKSILDDDLDVIINKLCGYSNKLALLNQSGNIKRYGDGWILDNGIYYSNFTYEPPQFRYVTYCNKNYSLWNCRTLLKKEDKQIAERIKYLKKNDSSFKKLYDEWQEYMDEEAILEAYERGWF